MNKRPIVFNAENIRAIREGRKFQFRKIIVPAENQRKWLPQDLLDKDVKEFIHVKDEYWNMVACRKLVIDNCGEKLYLHEDDLISAIKCPLGKVGDQLWVKETYTLAYDGVGHGVPIYRADPNTITGLGQWEAAGTMPMWASRITLEIESIKIERLRAISGFDARAEGYPFKMYDADILHYGGGKKTRQWFIENWGKTNKLHTWAANRHVWAFTFKAIKGKL